MITEKVVTELNQRIEKASRRYGAMPDSYHCLGALALEINEVHEAMQERKPWKVREELLDVATVAIRRVLAMDAEAGK